MKIFTKSRVLLFVLIIGFICGSFVACSKDPEQPEISTSGGETDTSNKDPNYTSDLPSDLNFPNEVIRIVTRDADGVRDEFYCESTSLGDKVDSSVFTRNSAVEARFDVTLEMQLVADNGSDQHYTIVRQVERENLAGGSDTFDIVTAPQYTMLDSQKTGTFTNLLDLQYLDLSKYYWLQGLNEYASVGNAQYIASGMATLSVYRFMYVTIYNIDVFNSHSLEDLYDVVKDGSWTMEYQAALAQDLYADLNGNTQMDEDDVYGFVSGARTTVDAYWVSTESMVVGKSEDNYYTYTGSLERISGMVDKMLYLFYDCEGSYIVPYELDNTDNAEIVNVFAKGNTAMATMMINAVETRMTDVDFLFGVAPLPKYDTNQQNYDTYLQDQVTSIAIPSSKTEERRNMLGAIMEALAEEGYKNMYYTYFEDVLPYRYFNTMESVEMIQLIYENCNCAFVAMNSAMEFGWGSMLREIAASELNTTASRLASVQDKLPDEVEEFNDLYRELYEQMHN